MQDYTITIAETFRLEFTVTASSEEEAKLQAEKLYSVSPEQATTSFSDWENLGVL